MTEAKKAKNHAKSGAAPLTPEAAAALQSQVAAVAAACEAGGDLENLRELVTPKAQDLAWDLNLLEALGELNYAVIPALLSARFGGARDKARRKALKRVLHRLQTRGLAVPADLMPREEPAFGPAVGPAVKSTISPVLGNGDTYAVLEGPKDILGGNLFVALVNDAAGLQECHLLNLKRRQQAEFWDYYRQHGLSEWYPAPGPYAVRLLEEAFKADGARSAAKSTYMGLRDKIWKNWGRPDAVPELEEVLPAVEPGERQRLLELSRQLASRPVFLTWLPSMEELAPWVEKLQAAQQSPLVLTEAQQQARGEALVDEATRALYPPDSRPRWRRRLLAMAYCFSLGQQPEEARLARAAAEDLAAPECSVVAGESPFLRTLVQMGLGLAWDQSQKGQEAQSPSGLITLPGAPRLTGR